MAGPDRPAFTAVEGSNPLASKATIDTVSVTANSLSNPHRSATQPARNPLVLTMANAALEMVVNDIVRPGGIAAR